MGDPLPRGLCDPPRRTDKAKATPRCVPRQLIVVFQPSLPKDRFDRLLDTLGAKELSRLRTRPVHLLELPDGADLDRALARLSRIEGVRYAQPNTVTQLTRPANDPAYANQTYFHPGVPGSLELEAVWDITTGSRDVLVAVLDTGLREEARAQGVDDFHDKERWPDSVIYNHMSQSNLAWQQEEYPDYDDSDGNGYTGDLLGCNFVGFTRTGGSGTRPIDWTCGSTVDGHGHGTAMASIIGMVGNNGRGATGVAWRVKLLPVKVHDGGFTLSANWDLYEGVEYALARGADIVNISLVTRIGNVVIDDLVEAAPDTLFVTSAGNEGDDISKASALEIKPVAWGLPNVILVGAAVDTELASDSGWGTPVDVAAPSNRLPAMWNDGIVRESGGASTAAAVVSGLAALAHSICPSISPADLKATLVQTSVPLTGPPDRHIRGGLVHGPSFISGVQALCGASPPGGTPGGPTPEPTPSRDETESAGEKAGEEGGGGSLICGVSASGVSPLGLLLGLLAVGRRRRCREG